MRTSPKSGSPTWICLNRCYSLYGNLTIPRKAKHFHLPPTKVKQQEPGIVVTAQPTGVNHCHLCKMAHHCVMCMPVDQETVWVVIAAMK
jgi:hypothetical protein